MAKPGSQPDPKSAKKAGKKDKGPKKPGRLKQIGQAYKVTKQADPRIGWILLATFLFSTAVGIALFWLLPPAWLVFDVVSGILVGVLGMTFVFGRRATRSQLKQMEGQPGAAVAVLSMLKRGWRTDKVIAFNRQQDIVHRVVGPPGIILVGEGNPNRLKPLIAQERVKHQRVASEVPVHEVIVGYGEGEVPLGKLQRHVTKMKRQVRPAEMTDILARLKALDASRSNIPIPKGPVPTSMKGMRQGMRQNMRGR
jgi:MFS superfamily sulfate permease-like transporter